MNALIEGFEGLSGSLLPWVLIGVLLLAGLVFAIVAWRGRNGDFGGRSSTRGSSMMSKNRNSGTDTSLRSITELVDRWKSQRTYREVLQRSPPQDGPFKGWFDDETKLCGEFHTEKRKLQENQPMRESEHPQIQQRYLAVVGESGRKPMSSAMLAGIILLAIVEAFGFALILAEISSDSASMQLTQFAGAAIAIIIATALVVFAHFAGTWIYEQGYAHSAHLLAPSKSLVGSGTENLLIGKEDIDTEKHPSTRMFNRSKAVRDAATEAEKTGKLTPRWPISTWIYGVVIVAIAIGIGAVRFQQIAENASKETKRALSIATSESVQGDQRGPVVPGGVQSSKSELEKAVTDESIDQSRRTKYFGIIVFLMIFLCVQVMAVLLSNSRGFASDQGKKAYRKIENFEREHGDITLGQWKMRLQSFTDEADRFAQGALAEWQLGLQTAFATKAVPVPNEQFFAECVGDFSRRRYDVYLRLKAEMDAAGARAIHPNYLNGSTAQDSPHPIAAPAHQITSSLNTTANSTTDASPAISRADAAEVLVDYFVTSSTGGEKVERCTLFHLRQCVADGQFSDLAGLNVRLAGQPDRYVSYAAFVRRSVQA